MNSFEHLNTKRRASLLGKVKGIKFKWTVFILFLLLLNMFILGVFLLKGIHSHQKNTYENLLMENSKLSNLYIRERYISREDSVVKKLAKAQGLDIQVSDGENGTKMTLKNTDS